MTDSHIVSLVHSLVEVDLRGITPQGLQGHLRSKGWQLVEFVTGVSAVWNRDQYEVLVPLRMDSGYYPRRVHEVLLQAAEAMKMTPGALYFEILCRRSGDEGDEP